MPELIDKQASMRAICDGCFKSRAVDLELRCRGTCNVIDILQRQPTIEADIDRAEIMRLCNEIEDIVSEISKLSENYLIYSDCKSILDRTKAIGKEASEDVDN